MFNFLAALQEAFKPIHISNVDQLDTKQLSLMEDALMHLQSMASYKEEFEDASRDAVNEIYDESERKEFMSYADDVAKQYAECQAKLIEISRKLEGKVAA